MSRKDFQLIAEAIRSIDDESARKLAAEALARYLPDANPRFNRGRFMQACEASEG